MWPLLHTNILLFDQVSATLWLSLWLNSVGRAHERMNPSLSTFVSNSSLLAVVAIVAISLLTWYFLQWYRRVMTKMRTQQEEIEKYLKQDLQRQDYCKHLGHDLDEHCYCRRCLMSQHDWKVAGYEEYWVEDDPGALYLSSDFQPTGHHEKRERLTCARCGCT